MTFTSVLPDDPSFEDYTPGATYALGSIAVDEAEVVAFARRYDPQYFHTDPERSLQGPFGRLSASGWMTVGLLMNLTAGRFLSDSSLGSPGVDAIRWLAPVYPGDVLTAQVTVRSARRSRSKPDRGIVVSFSEVFNQDGALVMTQEATLMILCRGPGDKLSEAL